MATIITFAIVLIVLIISHEMGHAVAAKLSGCRVEEFGLGFPPRIFGKKIGETLYSLNLIPLGGFVKITGENDASPNDKNSDADPRSFANKSPIIKLIILLAGVFMNIVLAVVIFSIIAGVGADLPVEGIPQDMRLKNQRVEIVNIEKNETLSKAKIKAPSVLIAVEDEEIKTAEQAAEKIKNFTGKTMKLTLKTDGETRETTLSFPDGKEKGKPVGLALIDIATYDVAWWQAPWEGVKSTWRVVKMTAAGLGMLFRNLIFSGEVPNDVAGPVGIASIVSSVGKQGLMPLLELIAVLSVNLALLNALPIPALDGGRALFVLVESAGIRFFSGKPERLAHTIGFFLLILLVLLITINDIKRLIIP